ncbi:MAG: hypothetical protein H7329_12755 [Opitutaceae bacterium]|nr:hypothetical protein [Cytophagales bacterium]
MIVIYFVAYAIRNKVTDKYTRKYFIPALSLKLFGAIALGLVYQFYYKGGDTFGYYKNGSTVIWNTFLIDPLASFHLIFMKTCTFDNEYSQYMGDLLFICDESSFFVVRVAGTLGLLCFNTYSAIAMMFALISFVGVWNMFITFNKLYPTLRKNILLSCFLLPSVIFWGSGLLKDSLTFGSLGLFFSSFHTIFIEKKATKTTYLVFFISFWVIKSVKIYIILCFVPAALLWLFIYYNQKIKSKVTRILLRPLMIGIGVFFGYLAADYISKEDAKYSIDNITNTAKNTSEWLTYVGKSDKGSVYSLGEIDYSPIGMIKKFPAAVNVTLFRPYLWESKNLVMFLSAIESFFFLYLTLWTLWKIKFKRILNVISENPIVAASLVFSVTFAFAVGISTANFGTLVRYKIPIMPFYLISLLIIRYKGVKKKAETI